MSAQDNAVLARRIYQLFSEDKFDDVLELVSQDIEAVLVPFGQTFHGREGFMQFMRGFKGAFPDLRISVTNQVATDESVVARSTSSSARLCRSNTARSRACITTRMRLR